MVPGTGLEPVRSFDQRILSRVSAQKQMGLYVAVRGVVFPRISGRFKTAEYRLPRSGVACLLRVLKYRQSKICNILKNKRAPVAQ